MTCPVSNPTCHRETEAHCPTRNADGSYRCTLGRAPVSYQLKFREDGQVTATLSIVHRTWLAYVAKMGGEVIIDWEQAENQRLKKAPKTIRQELLPLMEQQLMTEVPFVSTSRSLLRLTDAGRNVVAQIEKPA